LQEEKYEDGNIGVMALACKGICVRYHVVRKLCKGATENWYAKGRYCKTCSEYVNFDGIHGNKCLCCNRQVRAMPHLTADKKSNHREIKRID
jgi:hypothetical protein